MDSNERIEFTTTLARVIGRILPRTSSQPALTNIIKFVDAKKLTARAKLCGGTMEIEFGASNILIARDLFASIFSLPESL